MMKLNNKYIPNIFRKYNIAPSAGCNVINLCAAEETRSAAWLHLVREQLSKILPKAHLIQGLSVFTYVTAFQLYVDTFVLVW